MILCIFGIILCKVRSEVFIGFKLTCFFFMKNIFCVVKVVRVNIYLHHFLNFIQLYIN